MVACDANEDDSGGPEAKGLISELTTVLEDGCIAAKGGNTTDVGLPIEEELKDRLGAVGTRFGDS